MIILGIFIVAYGVTSTAIIRPKVTFFLTLRDVFFHPYFNTFGELFIDGEKTNGKTRFGVNATNEFAEPIALGFLGIYLLVANVLLVNLLIAIFNTSFVSIQAQSDRLWKFNRFALIYEYKYRPCLCPPFSIFEHILTFIRWIYRLCYRAHKKIPAHPEREVDDKLQLRKMQTKIVSKILDNAAMEIRIHELKVLKGH